MGQKYFDPSHPGRLAFDRSLYERIRNSRRKLVRQFVIAPRTGEAWPVLSGQLCRIVAVDGPQAGDFNVWNLNNPRERFWCARSRQLNGAHVSTFSRLWSTLPYLRPMLTLTDDTVPLSENGVRPHDLLGTRCDSYLFKLVTGEEVDTTCHTLLSRAVAPFHLTELDVHDVVNLFQPAYLDPADEIPIMDPVPARQGDFVEFFAEIDLLCALAACHSGDFSVPGSQVAGGQQFRDGGGLASAITCRPLGVEIYDIDRRALADWTPPEPVELSSVYGVPR